MNNEIKTDEFGNVDIDYYVAKAHQERAKAISESFNSLKASISRLVKNAAPKMHLHVGSRHAH